MSTLMSIVIGSMFMAGTYLILRRRIVKLILGLAILSNATNLLIFAASGMRRGPPPIIPKGQESLMPPFADPLPQALILTAIVIGFAVLAFALVLAYRTTQAVGSDDLDAMRETDQ